MSLILGGLTDTELRATPVDVAFPAGGAPAPVSLADTVQLDAFSRLRVSQALTMFDSQQEYGLDTLRVWDAVVYDASGAAYTFAVSGTNGSATDGAGNAVGPRNVNTRMTPITVTSANGDRAILQSRQYIRYIPGKSHLILLTGVFATAASPAASFVLRTSTSGAMSDANEVLQADWNIDKMDGTGPSGITIDFTKTQILFAQAQWLGVGRVIVGFDIDGQLFACHAFNNANSLTVPYTQTFNLPIRMEVQADGVNTEAKSGYFDSSNGIFLKTTSTGAGGSMNFVCCSVQSEGGEEPRGFPCSAPVGITTTAVTTRRPIASIRPALTYNGITNRAHIEDIHVQLRATTNDALFELVIGGTLTGAAFASVGTYSTVEIDTAATAITGGVSILKGFVPSAAGSISGISETDSDTRFPMILSQIDALTASQIPFSVVCTSFTGTSNVTPVINWHEQTI